MELIPPVTVGLLAALCLTAVARAKTARGLLLASAAFIAVLFGLGSAFSSPNASGVDDFNGNMFDPASIMIMVACLLFLFMLPARILGLALEARNWRRTQTRWLDVAAISLVLGGLLLAIMPLLAL